MVGTGLVMFSVPIFSKLLLDSFLGRMSYPKFFGQMVMNVLIIFSAVIFYVAMVFLVRSRSQKEVLGDEVFIGEGVSGAGRVG